MSDIGEEVKGSVIVAAENAITRVFNSLRDGKISPDEAGDLVIELTALAVDVGAVAVNAYVPGAGSVADTLLTPALQRGALSIYELVDEALESNVDRIEARAARADAAGNTARASRLRARAERVRIRQAR